VEILHRAQNGLLRKKNKNTLLKMSSKKDAKKGKDKPKKAKAPAEVITREYTINLHKRLHGM